MTLELALKIEALISPGGMLLEHWATWKLRLLLGALTVLAPLPTEFATTSAILALISAAEAESEARRLVVTELLVSLDSRLVFVAELDGLGPFARGVMVMTRGLGIVKYAISMGSTNFSFLSQLHVGEMVVGRVAVATRT